MDSGLVQIVNKELSRWSPPRFLRGRFFASFKELKKFFKNRGYVVPDKRVDSGEVSFYSINCNDGETRNVAYGCSNCRIIVVDTPILRVEGNGASFGKELVFYCGNCEKLLLYQTLKVE